jgi:hypothetical protein
LLKHPSTKHDKYVVDKKQSNIWMISSFLYLIR